MSNNEARRKEMDQIASMEITWEDIVYSEGTRWSTVSPEDQKSVYWRITEEMKAKQKRGEKQPSYEELIVMIAKIALFIDSGTLGHIAEKWLNAVKRWDPLHVDHVLWTGYFW